MSILRDLFIFGFTGYTLYAIMSTNEAKSWLKNTTSYSNSYLHGDSVPSEVDQIRLIVLTVTSCWLVICLLRIIANMARTAFKLFLFLSILVYFYMFQFDLVASYIPQIRQFRMPKYVNDILPPVKRALRLGLISFADRIYDLAKLIR